MEPSNKQLAWSEPVGWFSLLVPLLTVAFTALSVSHQPEPRQNPIPRDFVLPILLNGVSLVAGIASMIHRPAYGRKWSTITVAWLGVLASALVGGVAVFGCLITNAIGRNC